MDNNIDLEKITNLSKGMPSALDFSIPPLPDFKHNDTINALNKIANTLIRLNDENKGLKEKYEWIQRFILYFTAFTFLFAFIASLPMLFNLLEGIQSMLK